VFDWFDSHGSLTTLDSKQAQPTTRPRTSSAIQFQSSSPNPHRCLFLLTCSQRIILAKTLRVDTADLLAGGVAAWSLFGPLHGYHLIATQPFVVMDLLSWNEEIDAKDEAKGLFPRLNRDAGMFLILSPVLSIDAFSDEETFRTGLLIKEL
jgi:hypothetical protein